MYLQGRGPPGYRVARICCDGLGSPGNFSAGRFMGGEECGLTRGPWKGQRTEGWPVCTSHRGGPATVDLPRMRPSLPHLCVSRPRAWARRKCLWNGCLQPAGAKPWGLGGSGFCGDSSTGDVWTRRPRALTMSSSKWAGRASPTGTGPREGCWRKRCLPAPERCGGGDPACLLRGRLAHRAGRPQN